MRLLALKALQNPRRGWKHVANPDVLSKFQHFLDKQCLDDWRCIGSSKRTRFRSGSWNVTDIQSHDKTLMNKGLLINDQSKWFLKMELAPSEDSVSDLSTMTHPSWVAPWAWLIFIELDKAVVLVWLDWPEKYKSKPQWGTISCQSKWLRSKSLQAINAGKDVEKMNPLTPSVGMQTSTATMENSVEIP